MTVTWWDPSKVRDAISRGAMIGCIQGGNIVHAEATRRIQGPPKTGRVYSRRGVRHQASAPGESPATDTGRLIQSGAVIPDPAAIAVRVNWSSLHAKFLELGTRKMSPRPFARISLMAKADDVKAAIAAGIRAAL